MKPKCPKCGKSLDSPKNAWGRTDGASTVACFCGWSRRVSRAAIIRLATEMRETCKWTMPKPATGWIETSCERTVPWGWNEQMRFCFRCGKPVEVVNG